MKKNSIETTQPNVEQEKSLKKEKILKESFIEQELINSSLIQKELMLTVKALSEDLKNLDTTLKLIQKHEFAQFHQSKWRIIAYNILLGILFAIGTVLGLAIFSWTTYTFFKDNEMLKQIVDKQLDSRNFNLSEIRDKAVRDAAGTGISSFGGFVGSFSGASTSGEGSGGSFSGSVR